MIKHLIFFSTTLFSVSLFGQDNNVIFKNKEYLFRFNYNDSDFTGKLTVTKDRKTIFENNYEYDRITSIQALDLNNDGKTEYLIDFFTGGAHCCWYLQIVEIKNDRLIFTDSLFWGNSGYTVKDIDKDGEYELDGSNDMFAYAFTNYAQSFFSAAIYKYNGKKFYFANNEFEHEVYKHIGQLKEALKEYTSKGFECPPNDSEDTFNTDAGAVKAILAPITADYTSIGKAALGYKLINEFYKCPDREKFIKILKNEYNLK